MINKKVFLENLKLTQNYCGSKIKGTSKNLASILRTINPAIGGKQIFHFDILQLDYLKLESLNSTVWNLNHDQCYTSIFLDLFKTQLLTKKENNEISDVEFNGRILVSEYKCSVIDGASEVEAKGLIDIYDLTPIDTWFYLDNRNNLLFSWIPEKYINLVDKAVLVNCVDILKWMDTDYKNLYLSIFEEETEEELLIENHLNNSSPNQSLKEKLKKKISAIFK